MTFTEDMPPFKRIRYPATTPPDGTKYPHCPVCKERALVLELAKDDQPCAEHKPS